MVRALLVHRLDVSRALFWSSPIHCTGTKPSRSLTATIGAFTSALKVTTVVICGWVSWSRRRLATFTASPSRWPRWSVRTSVPHW